MRMTYLSRGGVEETRDDRLLFNFAQLHRSVSATVPGGGARERTL